MLDFNILSENNPHETWFETEHGLSFWIEAFGKKILFDTGSSDVFLKNARRYGIPVESLDALVLSHGHYDHTGGLGALSERLLRPVDVYAHKDVTVERYSRKPDGSVHSASITPAAREFIEGPLCIFKPITEPTRIFHDVWVTGPVERLNDIEDTGGDFWLDRECSRPDLIVDDQSLWIERQEGLWIFLGCAHAGIMNIINHIRKFTGDKKIHAVIGGTHLRKASPERLQKTAEFIRNLDIEIFRPLHCSGTAIKEIMHID